MRHDEPTVRSYAVTHPVGEVHLPTQSGWDQVIYAKSGLFVVTTEDETWSVPPHRAMCLSDGTTARIVTKRPTVMRCLYLQRRLEALPATNRVVTVSAFARELLLHAIDRCPLDGDDPSHAALIQLVIEQLAEASTVSLHLPSPSDDRCRQLVAVLVADPSIALRTAIEQVPASRRTLERCILEDTGLTLAGWQRRARMLAAIEWLSGGASVAEAAIRVGFATPSSFVASFRAETGTTPGRFLDHG